MTARSPTEAMVSSLSAVLITVSTHGMQEANVLRLCLSVTIERMCVLHHVGRITGLAGVHVPYRCAEPE
jgi:hypothetical protein